MPTSTRGRQNHGRTLSGGGCRLVAGLALASTALVVGGLVPPGPRARGERDDAPVPTNGPAWRAVGTVSPDLRGVRRVPVAAAAIDPAVWRATLAHRARFLDDADVPANIQVSRDGVTVGATRRVTDFSEGMLAIDPRDEDHLLGCSKFFYQPATYSFYTGVFESTDGGLTWDQRQPDGIERYSLTSDPVTAFDGDGNGYFTLLTRRPTGLDMLKKPAGRAWEAPVPVDRTTLTDKQWIAADQDPRGESPHEGNVYMTWTAIAAASESRILLARSTDGNRTWSAPVEVASGDDVQGSVPAVAPDGAVYVAFGRNLFDARGRSTLEVARSGDGGQRFGAPVVVVRFTGVPFQLPNTTFRTPASMPAFAVSPSSGTLLVAWADYGRGDSDVMLARSTNQGRTWSDPIRLNDDPPRNGLDQFQPQLAAAPDGRVVAAWFDRRLPCPDLAWIPREHVGRENLCIDTFLARSHDDGANWSANLRVSAQTWDPSLNLPDVGGGVGFIGDYQGLAAGRAFDLPFWNATADLGDNPLRHQQYFIARVPAGLAPGTPVASPTFTPTPHPTVTTSAPATATATASPAATSTDTPTDTPTGTPALTASATDTVTPTPTGDATLVPPWTAVPSPSVTPSPEAWRARVLLPALMCTRRRAAAGS
jgi:hypothetical protein